MVSRVKWNDVSMSANSKCARGGAAVPSELEGGQRWEPVIAESYPVQRQYPPEHPFFELGNLTRTLLRRQMAPSTIKEIFRYTSTTYNLDIFHLFILFIDLYPTHIHTIVAYDFRYFESEDVFLSCPVLGCRKVFSSGSRFDDHLQCAHKYECLKCRAVQPW